MKPSLDVQLFMLIVFAFATNTSAKVRKVDGKLLDFLLLNFIILA